jgi:Family of unknown function (DUF6328)
MDAAPDPDDPATLDRNVNELLQELRVTQTGVQLLSGFLLTVPFTPRFGDLDTLQTGVYVAAFCCSVLATVLLVAPVAFHRVLFRRRQRRWIVEAANWCALGGLGVLALTTGGILFLVLDVVGPRILAAVAVTVCLALFAAVWLVLPIVGAARSRSTGNAVPEQ